MSGIDQKILRIGVFYDGNFFVHVSNYYRYSHPRQKRISIPGLHEFIRHYVAREEGIEARYAHIVETHYFRGRLSASEAEARQSLYNERVFDDVLMGEGVVTHYLPVRNGYEKGIDVWLALEAFELSILKKFHVLVLIAGDSDFVPLVRKLNSLGTRVMLLGWDFQYTSQSGQDHYTTTSIDLLGEVTYPVMMHQIIDDKTKRDDPQIRDLFVDLPRTKTEDFRSFAPPSIPHTSIPQPPLPASTTNGTNGAYAGMILSLHKGYGFIKHADFPNNVFFHFQALTNAEPATLREYDTVEFSDVFQGPKGPVAGMVVAKFSAAEPMI